MMDASLIPFLRPRGVAVVGVSTSPKKLGYGIARNLIGSGYAGGIHFVSQRGGELFSRPLLTDVSQIPHPVDLAVLAVPAAAMVEALRQCARRGIRAAILVSAGFREAGADGARLEAECLDVARQHGMRLLGPNCIGIIDTHLPLDTTFLQPPLPADGGIGFVSHSGAFCAALIDWSRREGLGFSQVISLGNQVDINETDMLAAVAEDEQTRVIVLYMEGVSDGRGFVETARVVTRRKPVIALKVGRFEAARKAAASHTGALAASDDAFQAAFTKAGILRADTAQEAFDWARALEWCTLPAGRAVAVLTDAGGPGVIAADALEANGLTLAQLEPSTRSQLVDTLPPAASVRNPVDMLASASPHDYARSLGLLLGDKTVDAALVILPPPPMFSAESVADALKPAIAASRKPVVIALMGSTSIEQARVALNAAKIPNYPFPERAASALGALTRYATSLRRPLEQYARPPLKPEIDARIEATMPADRLIAAYGIPTAASLLAKSPEQAVAMAEQIGFPVALKIASPDILHKSETGGVMLDLRSAEAVLGGYTQVVESVSEAIPTARIDGVHVQRQVGAGQEIIMGAVCDPTFGPMIMFGSGGVEAEGMQDVAFALCPLSPQEAMHLIERTWAGRRLNGFRNIAAVDKAAVVDALVRLSWLAIDHSEIKEIEINPLRVFQHGAIALDVRMVR